MNSTNSAGEEFLQAIVQSEMKRKEDSDGMKGTENEREEEFNFTMLPLNDSILNENLVSVVVVRSR